MAQGGVVVCVRFLYSQQAVDSFYDRGSTFPIFMFRMTGLLDPQSSECQSCSENFRFVYLGRGLLVDRGSNFVFLLKVSFRVNYGASENSGGTSTAERLGSM